VAKLFGKHIARRNAVPRLAGKLIFRVAGRWDIAEIHLGHVANFVVIVEHHPPVTGDAEVFKQHIAREDIGGGKLANRVAVLFNRMQSPSCS
jgi:hypothetical protein